MNFKIGQYVKLTKSFCNIFQIDPTYKFLIIGICDQSDTVILLPLKYPNIGAKITPEDLKIDIKYLGKRVLHIGANEIIPLCESCKNEI